MSSHFWDLANFIGIPDIDIFIETWAFGQKPQTLVKFSWTQKTGIGPLSGDFGDLEYFYGVSEMYRPFLGIAAFHQLSGT